MAGERSASSSKLPSFTKLLYAVGSAGVIWIVTTQVSATVIQRVLTRKLGRKFDKKIAEAGLQAGRNWDAVQRVLGARLGRPIKLADLESFNAMRADYIWYYTEHVTRGLWLEWLAIKSSSLLRDNKRTAYMARLLAEHRDANQRLKPVLGHLREFGVPEPFLHVSFRDTFELSR